MNIKFIDDLTFDIYIMKNKVKNVDFSNKEELEKYLKKLFKILKDKYEIIIEGFYDIDIYIDNYYGIVLHLEKEDIEYYNYFKNQVDMRLTTIDTEFLYLVNDIPNLDKFKIVIKNNNMYLKIIEKLNDIEMMNLLEHSKIIYDII